MPNPDKKQPCPSALAAPFTPVIHSWDTLVVRIGGVVPATITYGHFADLLREGRSSGTVYIGDKDGKEVNVSFAQLRAFLFGPSGHSSTPAPAA